MITCDPECTAICDFCRYYNFNGEAKTLKDGAITQIYTGHGQCKHPDHPGPKDPDEWCEDFHCFTVTDSDSQEKVIKQAVKPKKED